MDPKELEALRLTIMKDAIIARAGRFAARWHAWEGAAGAALGLGVVAFLSGSLGLVPFIALVTVATAILVLTTRRTNIVEAQFRVDIHALLAHIERLKRTR